MVLVLRFYSIYNKTHMYARVLGRDVKKICGLKLLSVTKSLFVAQLQPKGPVCRVLPWYVLEIAHHNLPVIDCLVLEKPWSTSLSNQTCAVRRPIYLSAVVYYYMVYTDIRYNLWYGMLIATGILCCGLYKLHRIHLTTPSKYMSNFVKLLYFRSTWFLNSWSKYIFQDQQKGL